MRNNSPLRGDDRTRAFWKSSTTTRLKRVCWLEEQHQIQEKIQKLERQQRRQRQETFKVEDQIMEKRDQLIDQLEKRLAQRTHAETLFTIRWTVV